MNDNARIPVRPLSYDKIGNISNFKGEFSSYSSLPTTEVEENDYAVINGNLYVYDGNSWTQRDDVTSYVIPNEKEIIVDYDNGTIYVCDKNRNVVKASSAGGGSPKHLFTTISSSENLWNFDTEKHAYKQTIDLADIKGIHYPIVDIILSDNYTTALEELDQYKKIYKILTFDGYIEVYSNNPISINLNIILKIDG